MPHGRCAIYSFEGDDQEVIEKSRAGILPIFKQQPGFIAYGHGPEWSNHLDERLEY